MSVLERRLGKADELRDAVRRALEEPSPEGDLRAFAVGSLTCVVQWKPSALGGGRVVHDLSLRMRSGERAWAHDAVLADLSLLPRTVEHHLRHFDRVESPAPVLQGV